MVCVHTLARMWPMAIIGHAGITADPILHCTVRTDPWHAILHYYLCELPDNPPKHRFGILLLSMDTGQSSIACAGHMPCPPCRETPYYLFRVPSTYLGAEIAPSGVCAYGTLHAQIRAAGAPSIQNEATQNSNKRLLTAVTTVHAVAWGLCLEDQTVKCNAMQCNAVYVASSK